MPLFGLLQPVFMVSNLPPLIPDYGPADSARCLPCSGVSGVSGRIFHSIPRGKGATMEVSIVVRADSRRNSDYPKQSKPGFSRGRGRQAGDRFVSENLDDSEPLSLKTSPNGPALPLSGSPKFQATAAPGPREKEIIELFRKVQARLRERAGNREEKKVESLKGKNSEAETVDSLLKLLKKHSSTRNSARDFNLDDERKPNGLLHTVEKPHSRPVSKFRRRSPIPQSDNVGLSEGKGDGVAESEPEVEPGPESEVEAEPVLQPESVLEAEAEAEAEAGALQGNTFPGETEFELPQISSEGGDRKAPHESRDFSALKLAELRSLAKAGGAKGYSKMKKAELMELLSQSSS